jgi:hypothetical protein
VFGNVDLAIGTYRKAASEVIPDITRDRVAREAERRSSRRHRMSLNRPFVYAMTPQQYNEKYGNAYKKPGISRRSSSPSSRCCRSSVPFRPARVPAADT